MAVSSAKLHDEVIKLLESGAGDRALIACESAPSRAYPRVAEQVMRASAEPEASSDPTRLREQLTMVFENVYADEAQRIQSGRARDLIVLAVLLGAALYARASGLDVSQIFYALLGTGSALILWTVFSRRRVLDITRNARPSLIEAAASAAVRPNRSALRSSIAEGCPLCGSLDSIVVTDPARAQPPHDGRSDRYCRGYTLSQHPPCNRCWPNRLGRVNRSPDRSALSDNAG